ncbi:MAG: ATP12 family protein, partial [Novosphingobium sp.]
MKRFYKDVTLLSEEGGHRVALDGRGIRTQGGRAQIVPARSLAEAMATEWADQGETIDPARFAFRDMADYAIDVVPPDRAAAIAGVLRYAETDTLCYRADPDEPLYPRQREVWEPLLLAAEARWQVRFVRVSGIIHRA